MDKDSIIKNLTEELERIKKELIETKAHLKKYTSPTRSKIYYENHKEEIIQRVMEHKHNTNYVYISTPEQKKRWAKTAYLNKKAKLKASEEVELVIV
jgi:hypothetical protein